jgi:hypothetical protein
MNRFVFCRVSFLLLGLLVLGPLARIAPAEGRAPNASSLSGGQFYPVYLPWILQRPVLPFINCQPWPAAWVRLSPAPTYATEGVLFADGWIGERYHEQVVLYRSTDRGRTWTQLPLPGAYRFRSNLGFSRQFASDRTIYWDLDDSSLLRSTDGGETWKVRGEQPSDGSPEMATGGRDIVFMTLSGGPPFSDDKHGFFRSTDGGVTWEHIARGNMSHLTLSPAFEQDLTMMATTGSYHYNGGVVRSTDAGLTWQPARAGLYTYAGGTGPIRMSRDFARDHTAFTLSEGGLYRTVNGGDWWDELIDGRDPSYPYLNSLLLSPNYPEDHTLWVRGYGMGPSLSRDGGATWDSTPDNVSYDTVVQNCAEEGSCRVELFGETESDPAYYVRSFDWGHTWECVDVPALPPVPYMD